MTHIKMQQDKVEPVEKKLAEDRGVYYRDTVRVRSKHLQFGRLCRHSCSNEIVEYLQDKFSHGCLRLDPKNWVLQRSSGFWFINTTRGKSFPMEKSI
jgi:hypothetical protein